MEITYLFAVLFGTIILTVAASSKKKFVEGQSKRSKRGHKRWRHGLSRGKYLMYNCEWDMCESSNSSTPNELTKCKQFRYCYRKHIISYHCGKKIKKCEDSFPAKDFSPVCKYCFEKNIISIHDLKKRKELTTKSEQCHMVRSCLYHGYKHRLKRRNKIIQVICAKKIMDKYELHHKCSPRRSLRQNIAGKPTKLRYATPPQKSTQNSSFLTDEGISLELTTSSFTQNGNLTPSEVLTGNLTPFTETVENDRESNFEEIDEDQQSDHQDFIIIFVAIGTCVAAIIFTVGLVLFKTGKKIYKPSRDEQNTGPMNNAVDSCDDSSTYKSTYESTQMTFDCVVKHLEIPSCNDFDMLSKSEGTQTKITNVPKSICSLPWQASRDFTHLGGILRTPESDVSLVLTSGTVDKLYDVCIYGSVHVDLEMLTGTLGLEGKYICSPAPEYHMDGNWQLVIKKHMIINLPYVRPCENEMNPLIVYTFNLVLGKITLLPIPLKSKINSNDDLPDTYYEIDDEKKMIYIYTRHFCGFIACCGCGDLIQCHGTLDARIFGKSKMVRGRREVRIRYVIWDHKSSIADFRKQYLMERDDFKWLETTAIELSQKMTEDTVLTFELKVMNNKSKAWRCLGDEEEVFFPPQKSVALKTLFNCCRTRPYYFDWVMTKKCSKNDFGCIIRITDDLSVDEDEKVNKQPSYIDNVPDNSIWQMRKTDSSDILKDILKKKLTPAQVMILCRESRFDRCHEIEEDIRGNAPKVDFMEKWVNILFSLEEFRDKMEHFLRTANAQSAIEEIQKLPGNPHNRRSLSSVGSSINSVSNDCAMAEAELTPHFNRPRSPCENSDDDFQTVVHLYDNDQTYLKYLETEI